MKKLDWPFSLRNDVQSYRKEYKLRIFQAMYQLHDFGWVITTNWGVEIFKDPQLKSISFAAALKQTKVLT